MVVTASLPERSGAFEARRSEATPSVWPGLATGVLDLLHEAVLVIGLDARLFGLNRAARALLDEGDGLALSPRGVVASTPAATCELRRRIERTAHGEIGRLRVPRPGRAPLSVVDETHPLDSPELSGAVIFAIDPEQSRMPSAATLATRYALTPTECDVAQRLAGGSDLEEIAAELRITVNTVRGHLKQVFSKTGAHRQAELVARLLSEA